MAPSDDSPGDGSPGDRTPGDGSSPGAVRTEPGPRETQPLFLSEYWQKFSRPTPPEVKSPLVPSVVRSSSSLEMEPLDVDPLEMDGGEGRDASADRDPVPLAVLELSEFEDAFPSLPWDRSADVDLPFEPPEDAFWEAPDEPTTLRRREPAGSVEASGGDHQEPTHGSSQDPPQGPHQTGEIHALVAEPPSEEEEAMIRMSDGAELDRRFESDQPLSDQPPSDQSPSDQAPSDQSPSDQSPSDLPLVEGMPLSAQDEAFCRTRSPEEIGALLGQMREEPDSGEDLDVKKTGQFSSMVLAEELSTSVWDFSGESFQQREDGAQDRGDVLSGRYRIIDSLATGGMARIYRVQHTSLGKEFALKIIHSDLSADPLMRKNFIREARVSSLMEHPNIVQVTDFGVDERYGAYLVLEFLRGETLHERLSREGRLRLASALDIALQVSEALHYMHQQNIIHCDIKPENIFLHQPTTEGRRRVQVKLIDFGLSRREALGAQLARSEVGGTPHFMSPEQIRGLAPQPSMDIYSLGVLLYEMVVGELPFDGVVQQVLSAQLHDAPPRPSSRLEAPLVEYVDQLIMKALDKEAKRRQPSMGQMVFELRTLMEMLGFRSSRRGRVGRERPTPQVEDEQVEERLRVFEHCPCPLFRVDTQPRILVANPAFRQFVGCSEDEDLRGRPLDVTRLGQYCSTLRMDILEAALTRSPLQRVISFSKKGERTISVMLWLVPEVDEDTGVTTYVGTIVPVSAGS